MHRTLLWCGASHPQNTNSQYCTEYFVLLNVLHGTLKSFSFYKVELQFYLEAFESNHLHCNLKTPVFLNSIPKGYLFKRKMVKRMTISSGIQHKLDNTANDFDKHLSNLCVLASLTQRLKEAGFAPKIDSWNFISVGFLSENPISETSF